jgi:hypothetical protein
MPDGDAPDAGGKGFKMGDAFVDVHIDADKAAKKAAADLRKAKKELDEAAKEVGDSAGKQAGDKLGSATVKATKEKVDKEGPKLGKWIAISVFGGMPAAAQVAGTAAALGLAAVGAGVIGLAALATSQNEQVQQSYNQLWGTIRDGTVKAAAPLAGSISDAADQINTDLGQMTGSFQRMFKYAEPAIDDLAGGLTGLVRESMPGVVTASKNSEVAMKGFASMLTSTGKGLGEFLTNSSTAAASSSVIMASFGRIIQNLLGFAGSFFAQLSNAGVPVAIRFEQTLHLLEGTILRLGTGAFPVLFSAAGAGMDVLSGVLGVLGNFAPVIGPATGAVLALVAAGKLLNLLSFGRLSTELDRVKTSFKEADGVRGKFSAGLGALGSGFGLAGIAAIGVTAVLGMLGQQQAAAARRTQEHEERVDGLSAALRQSKGVIDANVRSVAAGQLADMKIADTKFKVLQVARELGLSIPLLTDAYVGNASAQEALKRQVDGMIPGLTEYQRINESGTDAEKKRLGMAGLRRAALNDTNGELGQAMQKYKDLTAAETESAASTENLRGAQARQKKTTEDLKAAFQVLAEPMGDVATRGKAIADAFDRLTGRQPELDEATKSWHEFMDNLKATDFESPAAGSRKWAAALVDVNGKINTTTKDGRTLYDLVQRGRTDFDNMAAAMSKAGVPAEEITKRLQGMRDGLVETITKMGFTKSQAELMANAFGLLPRDVSILVSTGGTSSAATAETMILGGKLKGLPPNTPVKVAALTDEARRLLESMGIQIRSLPDGQFEVIAHDSAATKTLESFIWYWSRRQINIPVLVTTPKNIPLKNMAGGMAQFAEGTNFAPGGLAVVGEKGPEIVSIPRGSKVYTNKESQQIVSGTTGSDGAVFPTGAGGDTYNNYFTVNTPAMPDIEVLVELLSRRLEQRMRQRWGA